ncbi:hypothetical protein EZJ43_13450 [Pedobacter changchengzhani]|uniref:Uncharacterized protein n=1 Tax=Pedobacter changchengzhani TaxID=2529274 RepID=A0A4R5MKK0_9SPHI|nr:hypothetical protein [Pedobacter changchengzhani]TDG35619.1 hypothetical protein EZJ43_13450 [Pedobacter changchengzhani]
MKQKLPVGRALLIALIITIIYLFVIFTLQEFNNYGGLVLFFATPGVFVGIFVWCYMMMIFEVTGIIAPHFLFRFLVPFLLFSLVFWVFANVGEDPIISSFQNYTFKEYIGYFLEFMKNASLILGSLFLLLAALFTLLVKTEKPNAIQKEA